MTPRPSAAPLALLAPILIALGGAAQGPAGPGPSTPERIEVGGIENAFRLGPSLYSGGDPRSDGDFEALKAHGVRTIISVDGAAPNVEAARRFGLRYVHLPIGYDGVPREQAVRLARAMRDVPGPVYVHCHHGKHRGPAAAAVCGIVADGWSRERALRWLDEAGTSPDYAGLFQSIREFVPPTAEEVERIGPDLPERAPVPDLVGLMVRLDARWDGMKALRANGFRPPPDHSDVDPAHEALQVVEAFREAARLDAAQARGDTFLRRLADAEANAESLRRALQEHAPAERTEAAFSAVSKSCTACHAQNRDR